MTDFHAWPFSHSHHAFRLLPGVTCCGVKLPLRVGCHCDAITGSLVSRSLNPGRTLRLVQYGQSLSLFTRWAMTAQKEWPLSQSHHTRRLEYTLTASGVSAPFFFRSHCSASRGCSEAEIIGIRGRTFCPAQNGQPAFDVTRAGNARLPAMSFRAPPPDLPMRSRHDLRRQQRGILLCVPLRKQIRKFCRQRVFLRQNSAARADGTAVPRARILTSER